MGNQTEQWIILEDDENSQAWDKVYYDFKFSPSVNPNIKPFKFKIPVDIYDITDSPIWKNNEEINTIIRSAFIECMSDDSYMYALDWHHTGFRYNPRIDAHLEYPIFINDDSYEGEGYNVYFPYFYPNGDYYFFIAKDFSCGYLTHPWLKKVCVFGKSLKKQFNINAEKIGFKRCSTV